MRNRYWLHLGLFIVTLVSATFVVAGWPPNWGMGLLYGIPLVVILLCHEMGHYLMCRRYRVPATLPYFIPFPLSIFGTMGAVIRMKQITGRKALFDIGIAGPLAGLLITLPVTYFGLQLSEVRGTGGLPDGVLTLGEPLLFQWLSHLALGPLPADADVVLHPMAFAGWAGFFVTSLNLLPAGQLDGGHVIHAMTPKLSHKISWLTLLGLAITAWFFSGWWFVVILVFFIGLRHPPVADTEELGQSRIWMGFLALIIFFLTFTPHPFGNIP